MFKRIWKMWILSTIIILGLTSGISYYLTRPITCPETPSSNQNINGVIIEDIGMRVCLGQRLVSRIGWPGYFVIDHAQYEYQVTTYASFVDAFVINLAWAGAAGLLLSLAYQRLRRVKG